MNKRAMGLGLFAAGAVAGVALVTAAGAQGNNRSATNGTPAGVVVQERDSHWSETPLESLEAEATPSQSIYLAAVQMVELNRSQGDVGAVLPLLEKLADDAPTAPLKNALKRLAADVAQEIGNTSKASSLLREILEQSLAQF